jgi:hypothetical protein
MCAAMILLGAGFGLLFDDFRVFRVFVLACIASGLVMVAAIGVNLWVS